MPEQHAERPLGNLFVEPGFQQLLTARIKNKNDDNAFVGIFDERQQIFFVRARQIAVFEQLIERHAAKPDQPTGLGFFGRLRRLIKHTCFARSGRPTGIGEIGKRKIIAVKGADIELAVAAEAHHVVDIILL